MYKSVKNQLFFYTLEGDDWASSPFHIIQQLRQHNFHCLNINTGIGMMCPEMEPVEC